VTEPLPLDLDAITAADVHAVVQTWSWRLWVDGAPAPQGSKSPMPIYAGTGPNRRIVKIAMVESSSERLKRWRKAVADTARDAWPGDPCGVQMLLGCRFLIPMMTKTRVGDWPSGSHVGDLSHLVRGVEDALKTAGVIVDDRLIVGYLGYPDTSKRFARPDEQPGCDIILRPAYPVSEQWAGMKPPIRSRTPR